MELKENKQSYSRYRKPLAAPLRTGSSHRDHSTARSPCRAPLHQGRKRSGCRVLSAASDTHAISTEDALQLPKSSVEQSVGTFPRTHTFLDCPSKKRFFFFFFFLLPNFRHLMIFLKISEYSSFYSTTFAKNL